MCRTAETSKQLKQLGPAPKLLWPALLRLCGMAVQQARAFCHDPCAPAAARPAPALASPAPSPTTWSRACAPAVIFTFLHTLQVDSHLPRSSPLRPPGPQRLSPRHASPRGHAAARHGV